MEENRLRETAEDLAKMKHTVILSKITHLLQERSYFYWKNRRLILDVHGFAHAIGSMPLTERDIVDTTNVSQPKMVTLHTDDDFKVQTELQNIIHLIQDQYVQFAQQVQQTPATLADALLEPITNVPLAIKDDKILNSVKTEIDTINDASRYEMTFQPSRMAGNSSMTRWQRLEISLDVPRDLHWLFGDAIGHYAINKYGLDRELVEERLSEDILARDPNARTEGQRSSPFTKIYEGMLTETVGQLKKAAIFAYLEYLTAQIPDETGVYTLADLLRRLQRLRDFIHNTDTIRTAKYTETDYTIGFFGAEFDIRTLFSPANVYDALPVIPDFKAHIGEVTDFQQDRNSYTFGARMKLNGTVNTEGIPDLASYEYHLRQLRGETREQQLNGTLVKPGFRYDDIVHLLILYYFAFAHASTPQFDPLTSIHAEVITPLLLINQQPWSIIQPVFHDIIELCAQGHPNVAVEQVVRILRMSTVIPGREWPIQLSVLSSIINGKHSFINDGPIRVDLLTSERKHYLRHFVVEPQRINDEAMFKLKGMIRFSDIHSYQKDINTQVIENMSFQYDMVEYNKLCKIILSWVSSPIQPDKAGPPKIDPSPIIHLAKEVSKFDKIYEHNKPYWFIYRYVAMTLSYIGIATIASYFTQPRNTFMALARQHQTELGLSNSNDPESFLATMGKTLAFILGHDYLANSQGIVLSKGTNQLSPYQVRNALASMYSVLPVRFQKGKSAGSNEVPFAIPQIAIVVVSNRATDSAGKKRNETQAVVYGEVISVLKQGAFVHLQRVRTFSGNAPARTIPRRTEAVVEQIDKLYKEGYRHILYIAQSPNTSKLHIAGDDELEITDKERSGFYYLSAENINAMLKVGDSEGERQDLYIYPIFRDQYPAFSLQPFAAKTWEISDMRELQKIIVDRTSGRQMAVFFNLFSNKQVAVGKKGNRHYHSVVSYATLLHYYTPLINDQAIMGNLMSKGDAHETLIRALVMLHLARNESTSNESIIKLDPFDGIIGPDSVGTTALCNHISDRYSFNFLGFLSLIRETMKGTI